MEKRKIYGAIIGVVLFIMLALSFTYAWFQWTSGSSDNTNIKLTVSKNLEGLIVYNPGTSILETANKTLDATNSYTGGISTTIEFWKNSKAASKTIYGQISLEILKMLSVSGTNDANIGKTETVKWAITTYNVNNTTEVLVQQGTFKGKSKGYKFPLTTNFALNSFQTYYKIYLWLDASSFDFSKSVVGEVLSTEISASATDVISHYGMSPTQVLTNLNLKSSLKTGTPSFARTSCSSGCGDTNVGIYSTFDDFGTSYYFRGDVSNNYVYFAGFYWRIVRINGDGSVRIIYEGTSAHSNGTSSTDKRIGTSAYKSSTYNDNTYVGYMYGSAGASAYANTHSNTTNSSVKAALDAWYKTNIVDKGYSEFVMDAIYCNDRSLSSGTGVGTVDTNYGAYGRLNNSKSPTLQCDLANYTKDKFTVSSAIGNGKMSSTYPIGLITADEIAMAGGVVGANNTSYYLYSGNQFLTMTPHSFSSSTAYIYGVNGSGNLVSSNAGTSYSIRPVISLKPDALKTGSGTASSPFKVA